MLIRHIGCIVVGCWQLVRLSLTRRGIHRRDFFKEDSRGPTVTHDMVSRKDDQKLISRALDHLHPHQGAVLQVKGRDPHCLKDGLNALFSCLNGLLTDIDIGNV